MENQPSLNSIGSAFSETWAIFQKRASIIYTTTAVFLIPVAIGALIGAYYKYSVGSFIVSFSQYALLMALAFVIVREKALKDVISFFSDNWKNIFLTIIFFISLLLLGGIIIVPAFVFGVWFSFFAFVSAHENKFGLDSLLRSKEYVTGYFWPIFGRGFLLSVILLILNDVLGRMVLPTFYSMEIVYYVLKSVLPIVVIFPVASVFVFVIYKNIVELKKGILGLEIRESKTPWKIMIGIGIALQVMVWFFLAQYLNIIQSQIMRLF